MNTSTARQECATPIIFVHYVQNDRQTPHRCCGLLTPNSTAFELAPPGKRGSLGLEWLEGLLYQTPGTFSQQTLLEALIVTGGSASYVFR